MVKIMFLPRSTPPPERTWPGFIDAAKFSIMLLSKNLSFALKSFSQNLKTDKILNKYFFQSFEQMPMFMNFGP